jgi:hypothetical protein
LISQSRGLGDVYKRQSEQRQIIRWAIDVDPLAI